jgi:hypothetical protein
MSTPSVDLDKIEALAKAAIAGPWEADTSGHNRIDLCNNVLFDSHGKSICDSLNADLVCVRPEYDEQGVSYFDDGTLATFKFIAAINPAVVLQWVAETRAKDVAMKSQIHMTEGLLKSRNEVDDKLRVAVEALEKIDSYAVHDTYRGTSKDDRITAIARIVRTALATLSGHAGGTHKEGN